MLIQNGVVDSQIDPNDILKNVYCSKLYYYSSFYSLGWNILLTRIFYFMFDTYNFEFIHLLHKG